MIYKLTRTAQILFAAMAFLISSRPLAAQDTLKVLFVGNSLTYYNDMPGMFKTFAASKGDVVIKDQVTPGGQTIRDHYNSYVVQPKLQSTKYDYTILQEQSQIPTIPWWRNFSLNNHSTKFYNNFIKPLCSKVAFYQTIGYRDGGQQCDPSGFHCSYPLADYFQYQDTINKAYEDIAKQLDAVICPIGEAAKAAKLKDPSLDLWASDGRHPGVRGTYLGVCVMYAALFKKSPKGSSFYSSLSSAEAQFLQHVADSIVFSDTLRWQLHKQDSVQKARIASILQDTIVVDGLIPTICGQSGAITLRAPQGPNKFNQYIWSTGDTASAINVSNPGQYWVKGICPEGCEFYIDTITVDRDTTTVTSEIYFEAAIAPDTLWLCGDSDSLVLSGPDNKFFYQWFPLLQNTQSITVTFPGTYSIRHMKNNGCSSLARSLTVLKRSTDTTIRPNIIIGGTATSSDTLYLCGPKDSIVFTVDSSYTDVYWNNGALGNSITISDTGMVYVDSAKTRSGCGTAPSKPLWVFTKPLIAPTIRLSNDTLYANAVQADTYFWLSSCGDTISTSLPQLFLDTCEGQYSVFYKSGNCFSPISDSILYKKIPTSALPSLIGTMKVYPNPAKSSFTILLGEQSIEHNEYRLISLDGKQVLSGEFTGKIKHVDISHLPKGMYYLAIWNEKTASSHKMMIE